MKVLDEKTARPARPRIVLVEDAEAEVYLVREALLRGGLEFELEALDDGEKAVDYIDRLDAGHFGPHPDLILLDLNLPKKSGGQVLERIRQSHVCGRVPVVVLTSSDSPSDKKQVARLQATQYFKKPSRLEEYMQLGSLVRDLLAQGAG